MRQWHHLLGLALLISAVPGCSTGANSVNVQAAARPVATPVARQDGNVAVLAGKLRGADRAPVSIVQLGDSHTAADLFSGEMRRLLQARYGDGGIGMVPASPVPGIRNDRVLIKSEKRQWELVSARNQQSQQFPLGGYLSLPLANRASVVLQARDEDRQRYKVSALYQSTASASLFVNAGQRRVLPASNGQWRFSPAYANVGLPVQLSVEGGRGVALGGWYIQGQKNTGVTYSALGINGARLEVVDKWQPGWRDSLKAVRPDLVILAYGTNEAFDDKLDLALYQSQLDTTLTGLRKDLPHAAILLVGPPDSIKQRKARSCAARQPQPLAAVIRVQKQMAQKHKALFWDWQGFMGGPCSIAGWQASGLARPDLVHLTAEGYRKSAVGLYEYLKGPLGLR
ncbi:MULTISPECIES: SGNH/GDSL hydrolase family protein [unclassified Pseudomonas]|uniref:SGNH/GDSL hydrolase family protein n=1 Tax=unclassified Pseudomonas TaxID=196821 RepID=UPI00244A0C0E|nr:MULTISPECIES: SGNH/GDSL hydrolase family protein [unclassified Pseudomonas]MDH0302325.1 SGNH/GDSL hydrolase family protein [Pseudomonas sp. GD04091]MDH1984767.1 SGNH/GDSL hydrolase family protein [Pseudomonas sp. GD03689]